MKKIHKWRETDCDGMEPSVTTCCGEEQCVCVYACLGVCVLVGCEHADEATQPCNEKWQRVGYNKATRGNNMWFKDQRKVN